jgi:hypothetical protein
VFAPRCIGGARVPVFFFRGLNQSGTSHQFGTG